MKGHSAAGAVLFRLVASGAVRCDPCCGYATRVGGGSIFGTVGLGTGAGGSRLFKLPRFNSLPLPRARPSGKSRMKTMSYKVPAHLRAETRRWIRQIQGDFNLESHHFRVLVRTAEAWDRGEQAREAIDANPWQLPAGYSGLRRRWPHWHRRPVGRAGWQGWLPRSDASPRNRYGPHQGQRAPRASAQSVRRTTHRSQ